MKSASLHKGARYLLALGTIAYGVASLLQPKRIAQLTNMEEDAVQALAMRDIGSGFDLLTAQNPAQALITRALFDLGDGAKLIRSRPSVAPLAFLWAALAVLVLLTRPPAPDEGEG